VEAGLVCVAFTGSVLPFGIPEITDGVSQRVTCVLRRVQNTECRCLVSRTLVAVPSVLIWVVHCPVTSSDRLQGNQTHAYSYILCPCSKLMNHGKNKTHMSLRSTINLSRDLSFQVRPSAELGALFPGERPHKRFE
jgi:hypothetical protein